MGEMDTSLIASNNKLIDLRQVATNPVNRFLLNALAQPIESTLSISEINRIYGRINLEEDIENPFNTCLKALNTNYTIKDEDSLKIPAQGPVLIAANHPFGGIEGVILGQIVKQVRPDIRILANYLLQKIPQLKDFIIPVDPFNNKNSTLTNGMAFREAIRWVEKGGALITFPSGTVSHLHLRKRRVIDPMWNKHIGGMVRRTHCAVCPVFIRGRNGSFFQLLGLLHPLMRTMMLPRELVNKQGKTIRVRVGNPMTWEKLKHFTSDRALTNHMRLKTYFLAHRDQSQKLVAKPSTLNRYEDIIPPIQKESLSHEISKLPSKATLVENGEYTVYLIEAERNPNIMLEIGRLREKTFRNVQEGTGKTFDLDHFDPHYYHLFIWQKQKHEIVGAYRLAPVDQIIKKHGMSGLYTSTLFRLKKGLMPALEHAVELGRSWIREEYQRRYHCLSLLWQGIGKYLISAGHYHTLIGPVSISHDYHYISKYLIVRFLRRHNYDLILSRHVAPYHPYKYPHIKFPEKTALIESLNDIDSISLLISEVEKDGKGVPVLLRQYLKLNARFLSFNIDPAFSDVIDGLIMTDLRTTEARILKRFMGAGGYEQFACNWQLQAAKTA